MTKSLTLPTKFPDCNSGSRRPAIISTCTLENGCERGSSEWEKRESDTPLKKRYRWVATSSNVLTVYLANPHCTFLRSLRNWMNGSKPHKRDNKAGSLQGSGRSCKVHTSNFLLSADRVMAKLKDSFREVMHWWVCINSEPGHGTVVRFRGVLPSRQFIGIGFWEAMWTDIFMVSQLPSS